MSSSEFQKRWESEDYKNYLKVIEALLYVRDGLGPFSKRIISEFQSEILTKCKIVPEECKTNTCTFKNIKNKKLQPECLNLCSAILKEVLSNIRRPKGNICLKNSKIHKWSVDAWEIAKVYMGEGQKANTGPQKSDSAAIIQLIANCKCFEKFASWDDAQKVRDKRNETMHSSTLSFTQDEMRDALTKMMDLLKKILQNLSAENESEIKEIKKTIDILDKLMTTEFEIFLKDNKKSPYEEEMKIFQERINDHGNRLSSLEELTEKAEMATEIRAVIPLLKMMQQNPDLMAELEDGFQNLISLSQLEELTELTEATASRVTVVEEDLSDLRKQVEALNLKSPDKNRSQVTNYKGQLQNFVASKGIRVLPEYKKWPTSNSKWLASVTVILDSEAKTFESPDPCQRIINAEHSAASEALQFLTQHEELFSASETPMTGADPKDLDKLLVSFGFAKPNYIDSNEKFTGSVKNFTASVTINVTGIIQKKLDDVNMKQAARMQAVAVEALKAIGQEVTAKSKDTLYSWCGRNRFTPPKYYPESPVETMNYIHVISSAFTEKHKVEVEGNWQTSKDKAKRSAAELLLKIIGETKLKDIWRSLCPSTGDSAATAVVKPSPPSDTHCNEVKAEAKTFENIKAMPTMLDSSSYCDELNSLCEKLALNPPEYNAVSTKESQFQVSVTMQFVFGPDDAKQFKNKPEAENEAARIALAVLTTDKTLESEQKKFKSLLNEFCQKQGIKDNAPVYITTGSEVNFHSKVKLKFVESCSEAFETESEACNVSAEKVLLKLGQAKNQLKKHCAEEPKVECFVCSNDSSSSGSMKPSQSSDTQCNDAKAEAKASENIKAMPTMLDSSSYCDELKSLCDKLGLNIPEYKVVQTKVNQFQASVTMHFVFGPDDGKQFKNKAEAENEAAHIALEVLTTNKTSESEQKKFKSLLNEFCQKQGIKDNAPVYITTGSDGNFHSKVKVKFVESCSEAFQTESEACNVSAEKVLLKLGQAKNHLELLKKHCAEIGLEEPKVECKSSADGGVETFRAVLDSKCTFVLEKPSQNKKDAEKTTASQVLKALYPHVDCSDLNKCKNLLQQKTPSDLPKYETEEREKGQFTCKVTVSFRMEGSGWHSNKEDALNEFARKFCQIYHL